ncbi:MAG: GNAT family N-acetyltransferase, partial [Methylococcaceae bacterium]|nr:GNAT family N-acetyltransferase [Methylococcaceae bacterium]
MQARILTGGLAGVDGADWNRLEGTAFPYLRHEFLLALETQGCLGERVGWQPYHLLIEGPEGRLLAALPQYLKF